MDLPVDAHIASMDRQRERLRRCEALAETAVDQKLDVQVAAGREPGGADETHPGTGRHLLADADPGDPTAWDAGLRLTGHFLEVFIFAALNKPLPPSRVWLVDRLREAGRL